ncbi:zinc carboxypeptidase-like isoform X2 [Bacillus rossius redtenbacheri]|uniref:zinc carboxypeptidase-like isoform X2 n=1 Tax=Bacillus rossius redtenbacheri TaxID=93214 RepID=UPI002FDEDEDD
MWTRLSLLGTLLAAVVALQAREARFDRFQVFRSLPASQQQLDALRNLELAKTELSFWRSASRLGAPVDVMVPPRHVKSFKRYLKRLDIAPTLLIKNVQRLIDQQKARYIHKSSTFGWNQYHRLDDIYLWLDTLSEKYPDVVTVISAGRSYEGRDIKGVKVSYRTNNSAIFLEAGIHAREWIAPATATYVLDQLLTSEDPGVRDMAEGFDWYIFPSVNPDGYEYTHTTNRFWRKTRSNGTVEGCHGADANRNFGFHWMEEGASDYPCDDIYAGAGPFSEPEVRHLADYITSVSSRIKIYLSFHAFSQLLLIPYGYSGVRVANFPQLMDIGTKTIETLAKRYGTEYEVGNIVDILYEASGSSLDWAKGTLDIPVTYVYELRDTGRYGFLLPADQILPTGEETLDSLVTLVREARKVL